MGKFIDLTNKQFGRLFVIRRAENSKDGNPIRYQTLCARINRQGWSPSLSLGKTVGKEVL